MSLAIVLLFVLLLAAGVYLSRLPGAYTVERSALMNGPREQVFEHLQDLQKWPQWSPWLLHDPQTQLQYDGDTRAIGGSQHWTSPLIGEGRIRHVHIQAPEVLTQDLQFIKPFKSQAQVRFELQTTANGQTQVSWHMSSQMPLFMRPFRAMLERMIGLDFELGLARLAACIDPQCEHPRLSFEGQAQLNAQRVAYENYQGPLSGLSDFMGPAYERLLQAVGTHLNGPALAAYDKVNIKKESTEGCAALPVDESYQGPQIKTLAGGPHFHVRLQGHYRFLGTAWNSTMGHVRMKKLQLDKSRPFLEIYRNDMRTLPNSNDWVTDLYVPIKNR